MQIKFAIYILLSCFSASLRAEMLIIINANNSLASIEHKQVVDLFMGRVTAFSNNQPAQTFDLHAGAPGRAIFYKALTGKSEAQVDAYWARLIFAGRMTPPKQFSNDQAIIEAVAKDPTAIAYVPKQILPPSVKVIMEIPADQ